MEGSSLFRQSSMDRIRSPEQLNDYLRVTHPGVWVLLAAVAVLLAGLLIWGCFTTIGSYAQGAARVEDGVMTVVFDAWKMKGGRGSREEKNGLEILYTEENETADSRIERMVHELGGKYHITVATSDGLEQLTVMRLGALRMSARELQEDIRRVSGPGED